jgi:hypothetical protein
MVVHTPPGKPTPRSPTAPGVTRRCQPAALAEMQDPCRRIPQSVAGFTELTAMLAEAGDDTCLDDSESGTLPVCGDT